MTIHSKNFFIFSLLALLLGLLLIPRVAWPQQYAYQGCYENERSLDDRRAAHQNLRISMSSAIIPALRLRVPCRHTGVHGLRSKPNSHHSKD